MRKWILLTTLFTLTSCDQISGILSTKEEISFQNTKGKSVTLEALKDYKAAVKIKNKKLIRLKFDEMKDEVEFKIPNESKIPDNGAFKFSAAEVGQAVDVSGDVKTVVTNSKEMTSYEQCQYTTYEQVCRPDGKGGVVCSVVPVTRYGQQFTRYYYKNIDKNLKMSLSKPNDGEVAANFNGDISYQQKIYTEQWPCR